MHAEVHMAIQLYRNDVNYLHRVIDVSEPPCLCSYESLAESSFFYLNKLQSVRKD